MHGRDELDRRLERASHQHAPDGRSRKRSAMMLLVGAALGATIAYLLRR